MSSQTFLYRNFGLKEPVCDADGLYNGCLASPQQARIISYTAWLLGTTGIIGMYYGYRWLGLCTTIGAILGQLYWHNPTYSWRRTIDMAWAQLLLWGHLWVAVESPIFFTYGIIQILGIASYFVGWYFTKRGNSSWIATFFHILLHIAANASFLLLYTA